MSKALVAYFSASGVTAKLVKKPASAIDADLFEIRAETPYTKGGLDWTDKSSRSTREMQDKAFRPPVEGRVEDMGRCDTFYVGFPIWWYVAPTIINTFLEGYALTGKTIIPFATSGGSDMGSTNAGLKPSCPGAELREGKWFSASVQEAELKAWAEYV